MHFKHIIEAQQFDKNWLENEFFPLTDEMAKVVEAGGSNEFAGKRMIAFFYEPSTRTRASFEVAMDMWGGTVVFSTENAREFSSVAKGESLRDTIRVLNRYRPHVIVLRYHEEGGAKIASEASEFASIINAGDGTGQHPTQALIDIYTIRKRRGCIDGLKVAMVGDLKNGRTVRSLSYLLGKYFDITIYFVAPESTQIREDIKDYLRRHNIVFYEGTDLRAIAPVVDVVYQTRTQKERGSVLDRSDNNQGNFIVNGSILSLMKPRAIIMHPLPRNEEITLEVDQDPRAAYLTDQVDAGLFTRMALLKILLSPT